MQPQKMSASLAKRVAAKVGLPEDASAQEILEAVDSTLSQPTKPAAPAAPTAMSTDERLYQAAFGGGDD